MAPRHLAALACGLAALASASDVHRGRSWAILVAGSNGYGNLRHQADVAHAYQVLRAAGVGASRIITMMYDDVATDPANPFPGQLFNHPTGDRPGRDVYAGVHIDYTGGDVTAAHFLAVLTGNASGVPAGKPVLRSGKDDTLFVYYSDHGAAGLVAMPTGPYLYANDLSAALKAASSAGLFRKAVLYIEACESGSMCANGLMSDDSGIYCETAAGTDESSWGTFCPPDDIVNGTHVGSCLGDLYSVNFIENSEQRRPFGSARLTCVIESLQRQFSLVQARTTLSHVMQYGDVSFDSWRIGVFQGNMTAPQGATRGGRAQHPSAVSAEERRRQLERADTVLQPSEPSSARRRHHAVDARLATVHSLQARLAAAEAGGAGSASDVAADLRAALNAELTAAAVYDRAYSHVASSLLGADSAEEALATPLPAGGVITQWSCYKAANDAVAAACGAPSDYTLRYLRENVRACELTGGAAATVAAMLRDACAKAAREVAVTGIASVRIPVAATTVYEAAGAE